MVQEKSQPTRNDCVLDWMKQEIIAMARENYLYLAYMGHPPSDEEWGAELESMLPRELQLEGHDIRIE